MTGPSTPLDFSWSRSHRLRRDTVARFGPVFSLPLIKRVRQLILRSVSSGGRVLDVGAGDRRVQILLDRAGRQVSYRCVDHDPDLDSDFLSFEEADGEYECLLLLEVVEHLELPEILAWLRRARDLVVPGGVLIVSTPNTYAPTAYLQDATHRTPVCYDHLAALVTLSGFQVESIYRVFHDPFLQAALRRWVFGWAFRLFGLDYARQIALVARRPPS